MKYLRLLLLLICILAALGLSSVNAQSDEPEATFNPEELLVTLGVTEPGTDGTLTDLMVTVAQPTAGVLSAYQIDFGTEQYVFDLIKNGGLKIAFPSGFDLSLIQTVTVSDNFLPLELAVERFVVLDQLLTIYFQQVHSDDDLMLEDPVYVEVSLSVSSIGNPSATGAYQVAAVAFKQNGAVVAGPTLSSSFSIAPNNLAVITVYPGEPLTLRAGDDFTFHAEGFDQFGNKIEGLVLDWSLDCLECIGSFTDSTLYAVTPGQAHALATSGAITGQSELITVLPGDLARVDLVLSDTQFVGNPLRGFGEITLFDAFDNLKTDYSLSANPLYLGSDEGELDPDVLASDNLIVNGIVQLLDAQVVYRGSAINTDLTVDGDQGVSDATAISFNGYDILQVIDPGGGQLDTVYAEQPITAMVLIRPDGNLDPGEEIVIRAGLKSDNIFLVNNKSAGDLGDTDTLILDFMPKPEYPPDEDTLVIRLEASYELDGTIYTTIDSSVLPLMVLPSISTLSIVEGSFKPDSIVARHALDISFEASSNGFHGPVDSATLRIRVMDAIGGNSLSTLFEGTVMPVVSGNGVLSFYGISGYLKESLDPQWYPLQVRLQVYSPAGVMSLSDEYPDSAFVISSPRVGVNVESFGPTTVSAGAVAQFRFIIASDSDYPLDYVAESSSFTVSNAVFHAVTELLLSGDFIEPGENEFTSDGVFIPESLLDHELNVLAAVEYRIPGTPYAFRLETDFDQLSIPVTGLPMVQIQSVTAVAPNAPNVNANQPFQISAKVGNVSPNPVSALALALSSDGSSSYEVEPMLVSLGAFDTSEFVWEVTAASMPNPAEIFAVDIEESDVIQLPAIDHVALVTIETPAQLKLTYSLFGVEGGLIDYGHDFNLTVELVNEGTAIVTDGDYMLINSGLDGNGRDTLSGRISAGIHIDFSFIAPQHDTTIDLQFILLTRPLDLNIAAPALIGDTSFSVSVQVISAEADLHVVAAPIGTNLVLPGRVKEIFNLDMTNTGISTATSLELDRIVLLVTDSRGNGLDARSVFDLGNTGFFVQDQKMSSLTAGDSLLLFSFEDFVIAPQVTRSLVLRAEFEETDLPAIGFSLSRDGIVAHFVGGPSAGLSPRISSDVEEGVPLISSALAITAASLDGSFRIETNPFNPDDPFVTPVHFAYQLADDAPIEFRIFTVTGEEVYAIDYDAGSAGGMAGENIIEWNGRNNSGHVVVNGAYIAILSNVDTGESARIKIAVLK